ncbi:hypothetical protein [Janthinobacterium sp. PC23-8]|uniref:hypothetical protein n=1 Tax=Janthinobacterium sp. PC23-8 TaxID=2012679 RepID=UPI00159542FC|nr:hypothetical protein [Janthinobacterium sp. PC23-8]
MVWQISFARIIPAFQPLFLPEVGPLAWTQATARTHRQAVLQYADTTLVATQHKSGIAA